MCLFLMVPSVCRWHVIVAFPGLTDLLCGAIHIFEDAIIEINKIRETILIIICFKRHFSCPKNQNLRIT